MSYLQFAPIITILGAAFSHIYDVLSECRCRFRFFFALSLSHSYKNTLGNKYEYRYESHSFDLHYLIQNTGLDPHGIDIWSRTSSIEQSSVSYLIPFLALLFARLQLHFSSSLAGVLRRSHEDLGAANNNSTMIRFWHLTVCNIHRLVFAIHHSSQN